MFSNTDDGGSAEAILDAICDPEWTLAAADNVPYGTLFAQGGGSLDPPPEEACMVRARIAGRLRACAPAWRAMGANEEVMRMVESGYTIPFIGDRDKVPSFHAKGNGVGCDVHDAWLRKAIAEAEAVGAVSKVDERPHVVARVDVIPKATPGKFRIIVDLRCLNDFVLRRLFKYETLGTFRSMIHEGDYMFSFDLESGYYHLDVAPADRTFLGFMLFGRYYVWDVLPFGLRDACYAFTLLMSVPVNYLRGRGQRLLPYLDDFWFFNGVYDLKIVAFARHVFESLGFLLNEDKSVFVPALRLVGLGYVVDTILMRFSLKPERIAKFVAAAETVLASCEALGIVGARDVARVVGHIASASLVFGRRGTLNSRYITVAIAVPARLRRWSMRVKMCPTALAELRTWCESVQVVGLFSLIKSARRPPASIKLASDAGADAWGGHVEGSPLSEAAHGDFNGAQKLLSSTYRELVGVLGTLQAYVAVLDYGSVVDIQVDSLCAAQAHAKGGSLSRHESGRLLNHELILAIEVFCAAKAISLALVWVPRAANQRADDESKLVDVYNYALCRAQFDCLAAYWGPYAVDRFASSANALLPVFNSRWACPGSAGVDAFRAFWGGGIINWFHPPVPLIGLVLDKMRLDRAVGTILVPFTPYSAWWPLLHPSDGSPSPVLEWYSFEPTTYFVSFEAHTRASRGLAPWASLAFRLDFRSG